MRRFAVLLALSACVPFSTYQSARLLPAGKTDVTVAGGVVGVAQRNDTSNTSDPIVELAVRHGATPTIEVGVRGSRVITDPGKDAHFVAADAKFALVPETLAVSLPVGFGFTTDGAFSYNAQPTLLARVPLAPVADLELAAKTIFILLDNDSDLDILFAATVGLRLGPDIKHWWLQPEVGADFDPGEDGIGYHAGIALGFAP